MNKVDKMKLEEIKKHWDNLSEQYAKDLKSTTKTPTIKKLEINAIASIIKRILEHGNRISNILEIGCGNGYNLFGLSKSFPEIEFTGIDYSLGMIENAKELQKEKELKNIEFFTGDILNFQDLERIEGQYDFVFTDRCIINLNTLERQCKALANLSKVVKKNGYIALIENSDRTYDNQNQCRKVLGLGARKPDRYNLFLDEGKFIKFAVKELHLNLDDVFDFASLHDILLYVLIPKINALKVDYAHPLMEVVTELLLNLDLDQSSSFGEFGQNRLYLFSK